MIMVDDRTLLRPVISLQKYTSMGKPMNIPVT